MQEGWERSLEGSEIWSLWWKMESLTRLQQSPECICAQPCQQPAPTLPSSVPAAGGLEEGVTGSQVGHTWRG